MILKLIQLLILINITIPLSVHATMFDTISEKAKAQGFSGIIFYSTPSKNIVKTINNHEKFNADSQFAIGSVSKLFTQMAIYQLVEQGKINLNDPISKYLYNDQVPSTWVNWINKVKVKQLVTHRSGLPALLYPSEGINAIFNHSNDNYSLNRHFFQKENALFDEKLLKYNLEHADEDGSYYSNVGYNLLAIIIENSSGKPYDAYLKEHIFIPAKMKHSFSANASSHSLSRLLKGKHDVAKPFHYQIRFNDINEASHTESLSIKQNITTPTKDYNFIFTYGAGSVFSTINDLNNWIDTIFKTKKLFSSEKTKRQFIKLSQEDTLWGHQGELPGYQSMLLVDLNDMRSVIILSNLNYDMWSFYHEVVTLSGKNIKNFAKRGGVNGMEEELTKALEDNPYLMPVNLAVDILNNTGVNNSLFR
jgi:CubicO group peptidase (beta-lactamase class C family)